MHHALLCPGPDGRDEEDDEDGDGDDDEEGGGAAAAMAAAGGGGGGLAHAHAHAHGHAHGAGEDDAEDEDGEGGMAEEDEDEDEEEDGEDVNAAVLFRHQALATNEIFLLAGRMYCRVLAAWARNGNNLAAALEPFRVLHAEPWSRLFAKQQEGLAARRRFEAAQEAAEAGGGGGGGGGGMAVDAASGAAAARGAAERHFEDVAHRLHLVIRHPVEEGEGNGPGCGALRHRALAVGRTSAE
jgi:hypothetical protein